MIVNEMKNCYGIKNIKGKSIQLDEDSIIYAPNGTFKTSFFNSLKNARENRKDEITDRLTGTKGIFDVTIFGREITDEEVSFIFYNPKDLVLDVDNPMFYQSILSGVELPEESKYLSSILNNSETLVHSLSTDDLAIIEILDEDNDIIKLIKLAKYYGSNNIKDKCDKFKSVFDKKNKMTYDKLEKTGILNPELQEDLKLLGEKVNLNLSIVNANFNYVEAEKLLNLLKNFYSSGNSVNLMINGIEKKISTYEEYQQLYTKEKEIILSGLRDEKVYKDLINTLNNNAQNRIIRSKIIDNPISSLKQFTLNKVDYKLFDYCDFFESFDEVKVSNSIEFIKENYTPRWDSFNGILKEFNNRFSNTVKLMINETSDSRLGINLPRIDVSIHGKLLDSKYNISDIISSGELNALSMLQLYVKNITLVAKEQCIIIDDNHEVFDYAFKHGFIEYIIELMNNSQNRVIILSHNFDFLKTVASRISKYDNVSFYTAYADESQIVAINKIKKGKMQVLSLGNSFNNNKDNQVANIIGSIPLARNIFEFSDSTSNENYNKLTTFLHYSPELETQRICDIVKIFEQLNNNLNFNHDETVYLPALYKECDRISSHYLGNLTFRLEEKIILSIGIRLKFEKEFYHLIKDDDVKFNQTRAIYNNLAPGLKDKYNPIMIVTPDFIHINSFSYEPLVDIKIDRLITIYESLT